MNEKLGRFLIPLGAVIALLPGVSSSVALILGVLLALVVGNPYRDFSQKITHRLLALSVVGLGAGMNLLVVGQVGLQGIGYTVVGISLTLLLGFLFGRGLNVDKDTSLLISVGTAICGGSAIAAVAPVIKAKSHEVSVALGIVFLLNAIALFIFPPIGHFFGLNETQFGLWSALAIHDTSSVVGSALQYGPQALQIATTVKLARALWIVPVVLSIGFLRARSGETGNGKAKKPWFILGFIIAAALVTWIPALQPVGHFVESLAKHGLILTLFLIGSNLTKETLKSVGLRPFIQGFFLWIVMATGSLTALLLGWIH